MGAGGGCLPKDRKNCDKQKGLSCAWTPGKNHADCSLGLQLPRTASLLPKAVHLWRNFSKAFHLKKPYDMSGGSPPCLSKGPPSYTSFPFTLTSFSEQLSNPIIIVNSSLSPLQHSPALETFTFSFLCLGRT